MNLTSAPLRFIAAVVALWVGGRATVLIEPGPTGVPPHISKAPAVPPLLQPQPPPVQTPLVLARSRDAPQRPAGTFLAAKKTPPVASMPVTQQPAHGGVTPHMPPRLVSAGTTRARLTPLAYPVATRETMKRWSGTAYLFVRDDAGGAAIAAGGQLGGSQAFARIAYRIDRHLSASARIYSPLDSTKGAEGAIGIDLHLIGGNTPVRLSVERRVALGEQARDAWSAYVAGGFYASAPLGLEADGYAQAGVVGARRRDLFADGAVRIAKPIPLGGGARVAAGAGLWAAAQPGVERVDLGPRLSLSLPAGNSTIVAGLDLRLRVAGDAAPGSGLALTIGADF